MSTILIIAVKEVREALRNRWVVAMTLLMAALALTLSFLGSAPTGTIGAGPLEVTIVSLSSLTIFLLPLIALLLSFDAIVGEIDRGTMALLLSYPVARWQVMLGKFIGHAAVIAFATTLGYGAAGVALWFSDAPIEPESWRAFAAMIGTSIMLGAAFAALGYLASTIVRDRGTAAGIAVGIWLGFVMLYDMGLLGLLVADQGRTIDAGRGELAAAGEPRRYLPPVQPDRLQERQPVRRYRRAGGSGSVRRYRPAGHAGRLDRGTTGARRRHLLKEADLMRKLLSAILLAALPLLPLAGCKEDEAASPPPPPRVITADAMGHYCGMNMLDHPGPKGQIVLKGRERPVWLSSVRDTFAYTMLPEEFTITGRSMSPIWRRLPIRRTRISPSGRKRVTRGSSSTAG